MWFSYIVQRQLLTSLHKQFTSSLTLTIVSVSELVLFLVN